MDAAAEIVVAASPERVWRAFEPAGLCGWLCERAEGALVAGARVELGWPSLGLEVGLEVETIEPGRRLVLVGTGSAAGERQDTILTATASGTHVAVVHRGFDASSRGAARAAGTEAGWRVALRMLDLYLGGREGQALVGRAVVGTTAVDVGTLGAAIRDAAGLAGWLGPVAGSLDRDGASGAITLGRRRTAAIVLCQAAPYELALTLPAHDAVLRIRLIELGGATMAVLHVVAWSSPEHLDGLEAELAMSLSRLVGCKDDTLA